MTGFLRYSALLSWIIINYYDYSNLSVVMADRHIASPRRNTVPPMFAISSSETNNDSSKPSTFRFWRGYPNKKEKKENDSVPKEEEEKKKSWKETRKPSEDATSRGEDRKRRIPTIFGGKRNKSTDNKDSEEKVKESKEDKKSLYNSKNVKSSKNDESKDVPTENSNATVTTTSNITSSNVTSSEIKGGNTTTTDSSVLDKKKGNPIGRIPASAIGGPPVMMIRQPQPMRPQQNQLPTNQALAVTAIISLAGALSRLGIVLWISRTLSQAQEMRNPVQHFIWECLNDRYSKDSEVLAKALSKPPIGFSKLQWNKYIKATKTPKALKKKPIVPTKTTLVVDITPNKQQVNLNYLADVVNFLTSVHARQGFGPQVEVVLLLRSPGGSVTEFGLAAAQVARLEQSGMNTTVCVDDVAASGGYMIASQLSQIIAAPFAMVGSIGVISEGLNFNKILNKYGIKPLVLKAGEMKNPISTLGHVSDKAVQEETKRLEQVHESFIQLCQTKRSQLDSSICDGSVLIGERAIAYGMVDRVLTSDEYISELIQAGDYVLKLHQTQSRDHTSVFARALDVLPHLKQRIQNRNMSMDEVIGRIIQGLALVSMVRNRFF